MFWETIVRGDVVVAEVQTPVANCAPGARDADLSFSSLDSSVWRELLTQNAVFNREMQALPAPLHPLPSRVIVR